MSRFPVSGCSWGIADGVIVRALVPGASPEQVAALTGEVGRNCPEFPNALKSFRFW